MVRSTKPISSANFSETTALIRLSDGSAPLLTGDFVADTVATDEARLVAVSMTPLDGAGSVGENRWGGGPSDELVEQPCRVVGDRVDHVAEDRLSESRVGADTLGGGPHVQADRGRQAADRRHTGRQQRRVRGVVDLGERRGTGRRDQLVSAERRSGESPTPCRCAG